VRFLCCLLLLIPFPVIADSLNIGRVPPQRVVSLNLCADELLLALAEPQQIASVTWLVKDPTLSWYAQQAIDYPSNRGLAEEIIGLQPDLVLAGLFTPPATLNLLRRLHIPLKQVAMPTTLDEVQQQIIELAELLGRGAYGRKVVADMQLALASLPAVSPTAVAPSAVMYEPNGLTAAEGTLVNEIMRIAGLSNLAAIWKLSKFSRLDLEVLVYAQPDFLIMNNYAQKLPSLAQEMLRHPVLKKTFRSTQTVVVPSQSWSCGTPHIIEAIEILRLAAIGQAS
jgi:iron complex transport system substrate-binding protein